MFVLWSLPACDGVGVGALVNTLAINASNIESFQNCTKINGDIFLIETSFTGSVRNDNNEQAQPLAIAVSVC